VPKFGDILIEKAITSFLKGEAFYLYPKIKEVFYTYMPNLVTEKISGVELSPEELYLKKRNPKAFQLLQKIGKSNLKKWEPGWFKTFFG